jgi:Thioesterase-like superfamily
MQPESFYEPVGVVGGYRATPATAGPWDPASQHGGPPAALLATVIEACEPVDGLRLARITVELLSPVPVGEVVVQARVIRPGRRVRLLEATMDADGRPVALARAWQIASQPDLLPSVALSSPPERPAPGPVRFFTGNTEIQGYGAAVEWRLVTGGFDQLGAAAVWARARIPLVPDQPLTGLQRVLIVADSANGISGVLPFDDWLFVPTALTVTLHRHPRGEWIFMSAETRLSSDGIGSCHAELSDDDGPVGTASQPLVITRRAPG